MLLLLEITFFLSITGLGIELHTKLQTLDTWLIYIPLLGVVLLILLVLVTVLFGFHFRLLLINNTTNELLKKTMSKHTHRFNPFRLGGFINDLRSRYLIGYIPESVLSVKISRTQVLPNP